MNQESKTTTTTTTSTTSSTSSSTRSISSVTRDMEIIKNEFRDAIGFSMPQSIAYWVQSELLQNHLDSSDVLYALHETAMAPRPSWRYTMAIVRRLQKECPLPWDR